MTNILQRTGIAQKIDFNRFFSLIQAREKMIGDNKVLSKNVSNALFELDKERNSIFTSCDNQINDGAIAFNVGEADEKFKEIVVKPGEFSIIDLKLVSGFGDVAVIKKERWMPFLACLHVEYILANGDVGSSEITTQPIKIEITTAGDFIITDSFDSIGPPLFVISKWSLRRCSLGGWPETHEAVRTRFMRIQAAARKMSASAVDVWRS